MGEFENYVIAFLKFCVTYFGLFWSKKDFTADDESNLKFILKKKSRKMNVIMTTENINKTSN